MTRSACPYCGVGCGVDLAGPRAALAVAGDEAHPANLGRLCSKGAALSDTVGLDGRLLHPMAGARRVSWKDAIRDIAGRLSETIVRHGPDSVAFYVSGQLLTEDYYVANKLMKGFIGSGNIDTNSRLCMASAVAAQKQAFGEDVVPACYDDLDLADLVVFSGHNAAWTHPVLFRRMEAQASRGQQRIVIDPRVTDTASGALLHLKLKSQSDVRLWNGLCAHLLETGRIDRDYLRRHVSGLDALRTQLAADDQTLGAVAADCGLDAEDVRIFFDAFARTPRTVSLFSQGSNQSAQGVAKGLAVINAHLLTGRVGRQGASPFSITGQPNAMGGREVGGLANQLASHMDFSPAEIDRVRRFWNAPRMAEGPGLKAVDLFDAVHDGRIKAIWIMATNPAVSMPDANRVREALERCPLVVVSDVVADTDTSRLAHFRLPALAWGEKDGTVTNSERRISRQRAALPAPGEARADWRIIADVAAAMGWADAFGWRSAADVFSEWASLTNFENPPHAIPDRGGERKVLRLGPLAQLTTRQYAQLTPTVWPVREDGAGVLRPFADGVFPTPDGRARLVPVAAAKPATPTDFNWPIGLNTGRLRDQWHTMTRTGLSPRLMKHRNEPLLDMHVDDAAELGIREGDLVEVESRWGRAICKAAPGEAVRRGEAFAPMHWSACFASDGRVNNIVSPAVDPTSGQPEFKHTAARVSRIDLAWRGWFLSAEIIDPEAGLIWRRSPVEGGHRTEIAARPGGPDLRSAAQALMGEAIGERLELSDRRGDFLRIAQIESGRLTRAFFASSDRSPPDAGWLANLLGKEIDAGTRRMLLAGGVAGAARSRSVCACLDVDAATIEQAAVAHRGCDVRTIGERTGAGTSCGSCRPEIAAILQRLEAQTRETVSDAVS